jgi:hypothetical protein
MGMCSGLGVRIAMGTVDSKQDITVAKDSNEEQPILSFQPTNYILQDFEF